MGAAEEQSQIPSAGGREVSVMDMIGQTISHYKILSKLGEGGMGVVYKARDTKLDRDVALKFLPLELTKDPDARERFIHEAKAASALSHPNVCTIHDIQEHDHQLFIVMDYVDGQTLRQKKDTISIKQAIDIAIQVADGLAAAHEKGIVHRDIKPENIMIRRDGIVQVMDFGLAKLRGRATRLTKEGSTVGTAGYMSPEQIQGLDTDHRSDIFSYGVLLYEILTGELPFKGVHETALAYEIVNVDPAPMSSIKPNINPLLDAIVLECLEKEPQERTQSMAQVSLDLKRYKRESSRQRASRVTAAHAVNQTSAGTPTTASRAPARVGSFLWAITIVSVMIALTSLMFLLRRSEPPVAPVLRWEIVLPENVEMPDCDCPLLTISPDGKTIAYVGTEQQTRRLYLRRLDRFQTTVFDGTEGCEAPFFSPDGKWIGFFADKKLKKLFVASGSIETICDAPGSGGGSWGSENSILFASTPRDSVRWHLYTVPAQGGFPKELIVGKSDQRGEPGFPEWLPDQKGAIIFYYETSSFNVALYDPERNEIRGLLRNAASAHYADGYLFFARQNTINAVSFDLGSLAISGAEVQVIPDAKIVEVYAAQYAVAAGGLLAYVPSDRSAAGSQRKLVWVDRNGKITEERFTPDAYVDINLSPDGKKIALAIDGTNQDVWICDIARATTLRMSYKDDEDMAPVWTPDGKKVIFAAVKNADYTIVLRNADASGESTVLDMDAPFFPNSVSPDGRLLAYTRWTNGPHTWICPLTGNGKSYPLFNSPFDERNPQFSPDGHWVAYQSTESGGFEVYVSPFAGSAGKIRISNDGGQEPRWSRDGKELFYRNGRKMMAVKVELTPTFRAGDPTMLFEGDFDKPGTVAQYDVTPDGQRFLMIKGPERKLVKKINLVLNWKEELKNE
jgi:serine/threonine protein kinase/Tol biopolymer transport system component